MLPNKRQLDGLTFAENATREVRLNKGFLEEGLLISAKYTDTISVAATSVRAFPIPIKQIQLVADGGKVLHSVRPGDLAREAQIYEQSALAPIITPPPAVGVGAQAGEFNLFLPFKEPFAAEGAITNLPTWIFDELLLKIEWGGHAEVMVGGTGVITVQQLDVVQVGVQDDFSALGDPFVWGRQLLRSIRSFKEEVVTAVADQNFTIELPRTTDFRSIVLVTLDANLEPINTIINRVTLEIDSTLRQVSRVPYNSIRSDNAKLFGVALPNGVSILEFAEDQDIVPPNILEATKMSKLDLIIDKAAVAGTIRVYQKRIEVPDITEE